MTNIRVKLGSAFGRGCAKRNHFKTCRQINLAIGIQRCFFSGRLQLLDDLLGAEFCGQCLFNIHFYLPLLSCRTLIELYDRRDQNFS